MPRKVRVFANLLNGSVASVRSWEQGWRVPDGASQRLIAIARKHPSVILESLSLETDTDERPKSA